MVVREVISGGGREGSGVFVRVSFWKADLFLSNVVAELIDFEEAR